MLLLECIDEAIQEGSLVTARGLQRRFGGDWQRIEDHLQKRAREGVVRCTPTKGYKGLAPFTQYQVIHVA